MRASWLAVPLAMLLNTASARAAQEAAAPMRPVPPLPAIGLPLPHIGLPPPAPVETETPDDGGATRPRRPERDGGTANRRTSGRERHRQQPSIVFVPVLPIAPAPPDANTSSDPTVQRAPGSRASTPTTGADGTGTLAFDLEPSMSADVFVDGSYAGTTEIVGEGLELTAGRHTVELRASGFEMRRFETQIAAGKIVTFRGSLTKSEEPETQAPAAETPPSKPRTFYVVPGCYAGDVPPQPATLPAGCDASLVKTFTR